MKPLRELLETWQSWSAADTARRLGYRPDEGAATALDALRDGTELVELLRGWQWQAVHAARLQGSTWEAIAEVLRTDAAAAREDYAAAVERQEHLVASTPGLSRLREPYRAVL